MKISKTVLAAMFAIGIGSSCAHAQTVTGTTATFTAVVAQVNLSASTISLTQTLSGATAADNDAATATADYVASPVLLSAATVGAPVQATVQLVNGQPAVIALQTPDGSFFAMPNVAPPAAAASLVASDPVPFNPARLTPAGIQ